MMGDDYGMSKRKDKLIEGIFDIVEGWEDIRQDIDFLEVEVEGSDVFQIKYIYFDRNEWELYVDYDEVVYKREQDCYDELDSNGYIYDDMDDTFFLPSQMDGISHRAEVIRLLLVE